MIQKIDTVVHTDALLDKLENREPGSSGFFGNFTDE